MELARRHGVYRTARALPIDYGGMCGTRFPALTVLKRERWAPRWP